MDELTYIPERWDDRTLIQVRDGELMLFRCPPSRASKTQEGLDKQADIMNKAREGSINRPGAYCGSMTPGARKRMTKAITLMCQAIKPKWITNEVTGRMQLHRLSFVTLNVTAKKNMTAGDCYKNILQHFLQWLRRTKGVRFYVWKAELNERGQIHYHIIFPNFIHYKEIRATWNRLQREAGLLDEFAEKHKHADPNSTDIHEMKNVRKTAKYVVKELGKDLDANKLKAKKSILQDFKDGFITRETAEELFGEIDNDRFFTKGKIWDCSDNVSGINYFTMPLTVSQDMKIRNWIERKEETALFGDWWAVVDLTNNSPPSVLDPTERAAFEAHIDIIRNGGNKYLKQIQQFLN